MVIDLDFPVGSVCKNAWSSTAALHPCTVLQRYGDEKAAHCFINYILFEFFLGEVVSSNCPFIFSLLLHIDLIRSNFFQLLKHWGCVNFWKWVCSEPSQIPFLGHFCDQSMYLVKCLIQCSLLFVVLKRSDDPYRNQGLIPSLVYVEQYSLTVFQGTQVPKDFEWIWEKGNLFLACLDLF